MIYLNKVIKLSRKQKQKILNLNLTSFLLIYSHNKEFALLKKICGNFGEFSCIPSDSHTWIKLSFDKAIRCWYVEYVTLLGKKKKNRDENL